MAQSHEELVRWSLQKAEEYFTSAREKKFTGRLALQFLIRDNLVNVNRINRSIYNKYLEVASALHQAGYTQGKMFTKNEVREYLKLAEDVLTLVKSIVKMYPSRN